MAIAHLVDAGHFSTLDITHELLAHAEDSTDDGHLENSFVALGTGLVNLMFGGATAGLRQLCVRTVFEHCFVRPDSGPWSSERPIPQWLENLQPSISETLITEQLHLPQTATLYFELELFKRRLCCKLRAHRFPDVASLAEAREMFSESDELSSSGDESDGEFW